MPACETVQELLPWYPHGLAADEAKLVKAHIVHCGVCSEDLCEIRALRRELSREAPVSLQRTYQSLERQIRRETILDAVKAGVRDQVYSLIYSQLRQWLPVKIFD